MDYGSNRYLSPYPAFLVSSKSLNMSAESDNTEGDTGERGSSRNLEG